MLKGTPPENVIKAKYPNATVIYYDTASDAVLGVKQGNANAFIYDESVLKYYAMADNEYLVLDEMVGYVELALAINPQRPDIKEMADERIKELKANGVMEAMFNTWFVKDKPGPMPQIIIDSTATHNAFIKCGTSPYLEPFSYRDKDGNVVGFDAELAAYIAQSLQVRIVPEEMPQAELLNAVESGRVDIAGGGVIVTPERAGKVLFSEPYYSGNIGVLVVK